MKHGNIFFIFCTTITFLCLGLNFGCSKSSNAEKNSDLIERLIYSYEEIHKSALKEFDALDTDLKVRLIPDLIKALKYNKTGDRNAVVYRYRAADAIGWIGHAAKEVLPYLIQTMKYDESDIVREHAVAALGKVGLEQAQIPILIETLKDNRISWKVSNILAEMGKPATPYLIEALENKNERISMGAANALGIMGSNARDAAPALLKALKNTDEKYRHSFAYALVRVGPADMESIPILIQALKNKDERIRLSALDALVAKGNTSVPALIQILNDKDNDVRFWAIYALGRIGPNAKEATPAIINCINDKDEFIRGNAIWALKEIDSSSARKNLISFSDISKEELAAIGKMIEGPTERMNKIGHYPQDTTVMMQVIERLEKLEKCCISSPKRDQVFFMLGKAKIVMAYFIFGYNNYYPKVKDYYEKHQNDYNDVFGHIEYNFNDFQKLIYGYPNSPLAAEATFIIAKGNMAFRDCEGDLDCDLRVSIYSVLPFIKKYPNSPKIQEATGWINSDLQSLTEGYQEIFDIDTTRKLLNDYFDVIKTISDLDIRAESLYALARAFISTGQYDKAARIYKDLEANYTKYRNARSKAAYQMFDHSEEILKDKQLSQDKLSFYTNKLSDNSEKNRLQALDKISRKSNFDHPLLFSILLSVGDRLIKDESPKVRKQALEVISKFASQTSFFNSAVGACILHDPDSKNRYYCAMLAKTHKDLKEIHFYLYYYKDKIDEILNK